MLEGWLRLRYEFDRRLRPDAVVTRDVQGVSLRMPRSHRLPDYARVFPRYGQNLVEVARAVASGQAPLQMVDVGANVGDSALQVQAAVAARILCVEGDEYWLPFLRANCGSHPGIEIEPSLLATDEEGAALTARRGAGPTSFVPEPDGRPGATTVTAAELLRRHPTFDRIRLVKVDTDGHDPRLVPPLATALAPSHPVLFFEFDPDLAREVGDSRPHDVWESLRARGYPWVVVWDNMGGEVGVVSTRGAARAWTRAGTARERGYRYWDVAVVHAEDFAVVAALTGLDVPPTDDELISLPHRRPA